MSVSLAVLPNRLDFLAYGEWLTSYFPHDPLPGFGPLLTPGGRAVTRSAESARASMWISSTGGSAPLSAGSDLVARRGAMSVDFHQRWTREMPDCTLVEDSSARFAPGPAGGYTIDLRVALRVSAAFAIPPGRNGLVNILLAPQLLASAGGQVRNSAGQYGPEHMNGRLARWCAAVGVVDGETVGITVIDHPANPWHPCPWTVRNDGLLALAPFNWQSITLAAGQQTVFRCRVLVHRGYVDNGWADARIADLSREPAPRI